MFYSRLYTHIKGLNETSPIKNAAKRLWRSPIGRRLWEAGYRVDRFLHSTSQSEELQNIYNLNPARIRYDVPETWVDPWLSSARILAGDWDLPQRLFELDATHPLPPRYRDEQEFIRYHNLQVLRGFYEHFILGTPWLETTLYRHCLQRLASERPVPGFDVTSMEELPQKCAEMDELFQRIKSEGYKSQRELSRGRIGDEVSVLIGRNGGYLFNNGIHRLSIAKLLGVKEIPVRIDARHADWVRFRSEVQAVQVRDGHLYQPVTHPDLVDILSLYDDQRWDIIRRNLKTSSGVMLDIGANWGYFCHKFEELGFRCIAVENNPENLYFLRRLKTAENRAFEIVEKSIFQCDFTFKFDVVLALNVVHWFMADAKSHDMFLDFVRRLRCDELFLGLPATISSSKISNPYRDYNSLQLVQLILDHSPCLTMAELIGETRGRLLYRLHSA